MALTGLPLRGVDADRYGEIWGDVGRYGGGVALQVCHFVASTQTEIGDFCICVSILPSDRFDFETVPYDAIFTTVLDASYSHLPVFPDLPLLYGYSESASRPAFLT